MEYFAETSGIGALGLNVQSFLFQLISFVIVLVLLRLFVIKRVVATLEARRKATEESLQQATATEAKMRETEEKISKMLGDARVQADDIVAGGHKQSADIVEAAETKAAQRAAHIVAEAEAQLKQEVAKARDELKAETMQLVGLATSTVLKEKLDARKDNDLINDALAAARSKTQ